MKRSITIEWLSTLPRRGVLLLACLLAVTGGRAGEKAPAFPNYRNLKIYTTSVPDAKNPAKIVARTRFVNAGKETLEIGARLHSSRALKLSGGRFAKNVPPGKSADWRWNFTAPAGFTREVLTGRIDINGRPERDLYITVQGADPPDFADREVERITERARAVATFSPRNRQSVQAEMRELAARRPPSVLTLAAAGKTDYTIAVEALPAPPPGGQALAYWQERDLPAPERDLLLAVDDLQRCLKLQSDAILPVAATANGPAIRLRLAAVDAPGLQDACRLRTVGKDVVIEAAGPDGLRNGIYGLLTDHLDCHWFQPKELGEEIGIQPDKTVRLPALDEVQGSVWFSVSGVSWGYDRRWDERNRAFINRGRMHFGHAWETYINPREYPYDKYPEYYARDRKGQIRYYGSNRDSTNFCSTNPEVIEIVAKKVNAYFDSHPDAIIASLDPNDNAPFCLCDRCLAVDRQYGQNREDGAEATDRLIRFSNDIYARLKPEHKDKYLGILMYSYQIELPKDAKPHPRYAGYFCDVPSLFDHSRPWNDPTSYLNRHLCELIEGWKPLCAQLGFYDYYGHWRYFGPWGMVHKMREDLPAFHEFGGTFLVLECQPNMAAQGLNHYIAGRLAWDIDADVDILLEEFFTRYYGPAAEPMRQYWMAVERLYSLERPGVANAPRAAFRPEFWTELDGYLRQAQRIAAALPPEERRFTERVQVACDGFEYGRLTTEYDLRYGRFASQFRKPIDHAAAIDHLQAIRPRIEALWGQYPQDDQYKPRLLPGYFYESVDALIAKHMAALSR